MASIRYDLRASFGYQMRLLHVASDRLAREALAPFDITPARVTALIVIANNPGCTQTALGEALSINRASAMKLVNHLEGRGFIARETALDPRAHALVLTETGEEMLSRMIDALDHADDRTLSALDEAERHALTAAIGRLLDDRPG